MTKQTSNVKIVGVAETVAALRVFTPDLLKGMNAEIRRSLKPVRARAQGKFPDGQWSININQKKILGSIAATSGGVGGLKSRWGDSAPGIKAAIFEFAGSVQGGQTPQAQGLIRSLTERYGQPGRFLWSAWDELGAGVLQNIEEAVHRAERELQANMDAAGEGY